MIIAIFLCVETYYESKKIFLIIAQILFGSETSKLFISVRMFIAVFCVSYVVIFANTEVVCENYSRKNSSFIYRLRSSGSFLNSEYQI